MAKLCNDDDRVTRRPTYSTLGTVGATPIVKPASQSSRPRDSGAFPKPLRGGAVALRETGGKLVMRRALERFHIGPQCARLTPRNLQEIPMSKRIMSKRIALLAAVAATTLALATGPSIMTASAQMEKTVTVGGAPMYPSKNIVENAVNSKDHTTLVAAVKAAGLVETLQSPGPFTVFAPTNAAFAKLPAGTVETLVKPESKATLTKILTYHVVPGKMTAAAMMKAVKDGEGMAKLKTAAGETLTVKQEGPGKLSITDAKGGKSMVTIADVLQSNGVIHVVDTVLLPG
jgi:uncharacterized surface protein with fasciclin (FAS1) repeats